MAYICHVGFAGLAVGRADVLRSASLTASKTTTPPPTIDPLTGFQIPGVPSTGTLILPRNPQTQAHGGVVAYGFTAGLGVDVALLQNLFVRTEWEFIEFPNISDFRVQANSARVAVGLKF